MHVWEIFRWLLIPAVPAGAYVGVAATLRTFPAAERQSVTGRLRLAVECGGAALACAFVAAIAVLTGAALTSVAVDLIEGDHGPRFERVHEDQAAAGVRDVMGDPDYEAVAPPRTPVWVWVDRHKVYYVYFAPDAHLEPTGVASKRTVWCGGHRPELRDASGDTPLDIEC